MHPSCACLRWTTVPRPSRASRARCTGSTHMPFSNNSRIRHRKWIRSGWNKETTSLQRRWHTFHATLHGAKIVLHEPQDAVRRLRNRAFSRRAAEDGRPGDAACGGRVPCPARICVGGAGLPQAPARLPAGAVARHGLPISGRVCHTSLNKSIDSLTDRRRQWLSGSAPSTALLRTRAARRSREPCRPCAAHSTAPRCPSPRHTVRPSMDVMV